MIVVLGGLPDVERNLIPHLHGGGLKIYGDGRVEVEWAVACLTDLKFAYEKQPPSSYPKLKQHVGLSGVFLSRASILACALWPVC